MSKIRVILVLLGYFIARASGFLKISRTDRCLNSRRALSSSPSPAPSTKAQSGTKTDHDKSTSSTQKRVTVRFVTSNPLKTREVQTLLSEGGLDLPFDIVTADIHLPELQEDPTVICMEKCRLAAEFTQGAVLVEDTCLSFNALNGLPGPYIKFFLEELGNEGLFKMLSAYPDKTGVAICNVGWSAGPGQQPIVFSGRTYGEIVKPAPDENGFGWDGCFRPKGFDVTFADMSVQEKNAISHRSLALRQFQEYIKENYQGIEKYWREQSM